MSKTFLREIIGWKQGINMAKGKKEKSIEELTKKPNVLEELADKGQNVRGAIIALGGEIGLKRALSVTQNIDFYTYKIHFELEKK